MAFQWPDSDQRRRADPHLPFPKEPHKDASILMDTKNLNMGVSENSVPLNPMVNDHYPY